MESLNTGKKNIVPFPADFLLKLEREVYIFLSLTGGLTSRSILLSAFKHYVDPTSMLYSGKNSQDHLYMLFQNLRVVIRGLGKIGESEDIIILEEYKQNKSDLALLDKSDKYDVLLKRIKDCVDDSVLSILQKKKAT